MGWLDGALRIMPSWEFTGFGHTIPFEVFLPAVLFPGLTLQPLLRVAVHRSRESPATARPAQPSRPSPGQTPAHGDRGRRRWPSTSCSSRPARPTSSPTSLQISLNTVLWFFRFAVFVIPVIVGLVTWSICREMIGQHGIGKRKRAVVVTRSARGRIRHRAESAASGRPGGGARPRAGSRLHRGRAGTGGSGGRRGRGPAHSASGLALAIGLP